VTPRLIPAAMAALALLAATESAAARPDTRTLTCDGARSLVQSRGAVVVSTGRYTYDRAVSDQRYCDRGEIVETFIAPTLDNPRCRIGGYCKSRAPISR